MGWKTREEMLAYNKAYYLKNREKRIKEAKEWAEKNPEKRREISRRHSRKKQGTTKESLARSMTWKGRKYEMLALKTLKGSVDMNRDGMNKPYDILWKGKTVDVKSSNIYRRKFKRGEPVKKEQAGWWRFGSGKHKADLYFCVCLVENIPERIYLIPKEVFGNNKVIGNKTKYEKYRIQT